MLGKHILRQCDNTLGYGYLLIAAAQFLLTATLSAYAVAPAPSENEPRPAAHRAASEPGALLHAFVGIPYRNDGVVNDAGRYATFQEPAKSLSTPGLNCSGFVLEASRRLLGAHIPLVDAVRDRLGDSGSGSPLGKDWDFGWDLVLNISEGHARALLLPNGKQADPGPLSGSIQGFDLHSPKTWKELPGRLRPGFLYLFSFNKPSNRKGYTRQHYHVGLVWTSPQGNIWYYHSTPASRGVIRRDLATNEGRASFLRSFANTGAIRKMFAIIEVQLPD
jgi:cell wall-associated NlpC family hydrolase